MRSKTPASQTISFRLDADTMRILDQQRQPFNVSRGEWVRAVITNLLDGNGPPQSQAIEKYALELAGQVTTLQTQLNTVLYVVLVELAEMSPEEAKDIVRSSLISPE